MSLTLQRLQALKRQAGDTSVPAGANSIRDPQPIPQEPSRIESAAGTCTTPGAESHWAPAFAGATDIGATDAATPTPRHPGESRDPASSRTPLSDAALHALRHTLRIRQPVSRPSGARAADRTLPGEEIAPGLHLIQASVAAERLPPLLDGRFDRREAFDPARCLFFDTETTGLSGGTGTRAFMIGAAHWADGRLHVRQLLISRLGAEAAMLETFASWLRPDTLLVSYNGKSYDAPLLKTRYRLARKREPLSALQHLDLLYPSRRRYKGVYENCRLATIERQVLRIVREDDLPGSQAPAAWLHYIRGGSARNLRRVGEHNHQDVVSLAQLLLHLATLHVQDNEVPPFTRLHPLLMAANLRSGR